MYVIRYSEALEFVSKLNELTGQNFRLPTEAEWEFAARGGNKSQGYKYSGSDNLDAVAWHWGNAGRFDGGYARCPKPVKSLKANELGIYDMTGNVNEFTSDYWYRTFTEDPVTNPVTTAADAKNDPPYYMVRGGSYRYNSSRQHLSYRGFRVEMDAYHSDVGIRLAK